MMKLVVRCLVGTFLLSGGAFACAAQREQAAESGVETVAYRIVLHNELSDNIRYRYARLVPHEKPMLPQDPQPQATLDIGLVFETIAPGQSTVVTLKPGNKLTLLSPGPRGTQQTEVIADASVHLYVTPEGIFREENGDRILIQINE